MTTTKRRRDEGERAYYAFTVFCEMGPAKRTLAKVAKKLGKSATLIERYSSRYDWKERARLYDDEKRETDQTAEEKVALELARERAKRRELVSESAWDWFLKLKAKAEEMITFPVGTKTSKDGKTIYNPGKWSFRDMASMVETADKLARLATGLATDKHELTGPDDKPFTIPSAAAPATLILNVTYDKDTEAAVAKFGEPPDDLNGNRGG